MDWLEEQDSPCDASNDLVFNTADDGDLLGAPSCAPPMASEALEQHRAGGVGAELASFPEEELLQRLVQGLAVGSAPEQSIALASRPVLYYVDDDGFAREFDATLEDGWIIVGKGGGVDPRCHEQDDASAAAAAAALAPSSSAHVQHRPAPIRRPSNASSSRNVDGPTPKNADDADSTCDNFKLLWEKDPNLRTPGGRLGELKKSLSLKDKKLNSLQVQPVEPSLHTLDDDKHTFDNFDRLWERDPRFMDLGETSSQAPLREAVNKSPWKVEGCDIIQKHTLNVTNIVASSKAEQARFYASKAFDDPAVGKECRFSFEVDYEIKNRNAEEGSADATVSNALVTAGCSVQVQVVLKVDLKESERKFLYSFLHDVRVFSDFKLETEARLLHLSDIAVLSTVPEQFQEAGMEVTHHKVTHYISVYHSWAPAATPIRALEGARIPWRRMSASTSQSTAHQDVVQQRLPDEARGDGEKAEEEEEDVLKQAGGKALRSPRSKRRAHPYLQRSNSK